MASCARRKLACGQKIARPCRAVSPTALMRPTMARLAARARRDPFFGPPRRALQPLRRQHRCAGFPGWVRCIRHGPTNRSMAPVLFIRLSLNGDQICKGSHPPPMGPIFGVFLPMLHPTNGAVAPTYVVIDSHPWAATMAIHRLLQNSPMGPEEIGRLIGAYRQTLHALGLKDRRDRLTELVVAKVFEIGQTGVGDAAEISRRAIQPL
jgi:hypothetical protein